MRKKLFQHFAQGFLVEANDQLFPDAQYRSAECSRPAKNHSSNFVLVVVFLQIEMDELLSFANIKILHPVQQFERVAAFVADFSSVDFLDRVDTVVRKKLLRFFARRSAGAVVAPINLWHLLNLLCVVVKYQFDEPRMDTNKHKF